MFNLHFVNEKLEDRYITETYSARKFYLLIYFVICLIITLFEKKSLFPKTKWICVGLEVLILIIAYKS